MAERESMLDENPGRLMTITRCGNEALDLDLGHDIFDPPAGDDPAKLERLAAW